MWHIFRVEWSGSHVLHVYTTSQVAVFSAVWILWCTTHRGPQYMNLHRNIHLQALVNTRYAETAWSIWYTFTPCMGGSADSFGAKPSQ